MTLLCGLWVHPKSTGLRESPHTQSTLICVLLTLFLCQLAHMHSKLKYLVLPCEH